MESLATEEMSTMWIVGFIAIGIGVLAFVTTIQAMVMKFAVSACGGEQIGFLYAAFVAWSCGLCSGLGSAAVTLSSSDPSPWGSLAGGLTAAVGSLCLLLKMDPLRSFGVYLVHTVIGTIVTVIFTVITLVGLTVALPADAMNKLQTSAGQLAPRGNDPEATATDWQNLLNFGSTTENQGASDTPAPIPGLESNNPFFKTPSGPAAVGEASASTPSQRPAKTVKKEENDATTTSPFDNGIRSNPFVK
ncbi:hypothetical protein SH139x_002849 [Planctomycetaceae bacterium SH139]